ncbi:MAG TPA: hypothetical protein VGS79_04500 [Puia sp.]|nr:hypothetical protein [Puia sp.]
MLDEVYLYPLIVPKSYYVKGVWDLPHHAFPAEEFILTWVFCKKASGSMGYLTREQYEALEKDKPRWQQTAFENLRGKTGESSKFFTHYKLSEDESRIIFLAFTNEDGVGSSRVLCSHELSRAFPQGYSIAFPDRSCGFVIPNGLRPDELADVRKMLNKTLRGASVPMSDELFQPDRFVLPQSWLKPMDLGHANNVIKKISLFCKK